MNQIRFMWIKVNAPGAAKGLKLLQCQVQSVFYEEDVIVRSPNGNIISKLRYADLSRDGRW